MKQNDYFEQEFKREETEKLLRPWANKGISINRWVGDSKY